MQNLLVWATDWVPAIAFLAACIRLLWLYFVTDKGIQLSDALVPFVVSNYFYGLTAIRFWPYVLSSWIGMLPLTFLYVSLGAAAREAAGSPAAPAGPLKWAVLAGGVLVTLAATAYAGRIVKRALAESATDGH